MHSSHDVYFRNRLTIVLLHDVEHLVNCKFPAFFPMCVEPAVRAEIAAEHTDVGGFDMKVAVEVRAVAMLLLAYVIREASYKRKAALFEQHQGLLIGDSLKAGNLLRNRFQCGR